MPKPILMNDRERVRTEVVEFVKANPGRYTRRRILMKLGYWDQRRSTFMYNRIFKPLIDTDLVRIELATDGLGKVLPGRNAKNFNAEATARS